MARSFTRCARVGGAGDTICAVDVGSTLIKAAVYDDQLALVGHGRTEFPCTRTYARVESELEAVWASVTSAVRSAVASSPPPTTLIICAQMAGLVLLDADGHALRPAILGVDQRNTPETDPAGKLRWLRRHEADHLDAARHVGGIKEYLVRRLTGAWITDPSSASVTGMYDVFGHRWLPTVVEECGVDIRALPAVGSPAQSAGIATTEAAAEWGLSSPPSVLVGLGDGPAANLSCGAVGRSRLCLSLGTTVVARLLLNAADLPEATPSMFVQHVAGDWYCTGMRFDPAGEGVFAPMGAPKRQVGWAELCDLLGALLEPVRELRPSGSRSSDAELLRRLARACQRPVRGTASADGTRGVALLARAGAEQLDVIADRVRVTCEIPVADRTVPR